MSVTLLFFIIFISTTSVLLMIQNVYPQFDDPSGGGGGGFDQGQPQQNFQQQPNQQFQQQQPMYQQQPQYPMQQQPYQQQPYPPQQQPYPTYQQPYPPPYPPPSPGIDPTLLVTLVTTVLGGVGGTYVKVRRDMNKNKEVFKEKAEDLKTKTKEETLAEIQSMLLPLLKQNTAAVQQTAKQSVQMNQLAKLVYDTLGEQAENIHGMPEIQQQNLIRDALQSKLVAEQYKQQLKKVEQKAIVDTPPTVPAADTIDESPNDNPFG